MKYAFVLTAIAAFESVGLAAPAVDTNGNINLAAPIDKPASGLSTTASPDVGSKPDAGPQGPEGAPLPDSNTSSTSSSELAEKATKAASAIANAAAGSSSASTVPSVVADVKKVVQNAIGEGQASDAVIATCLAATVSGENPEAVVKITEESIKAVENASPTPDQNTVSRPGGDNSLDLDSIASNVVQACSTKMCDFLIRGYFRLKHEGKLTEYIFLVIGASQVVQKSSVNRQDQAAFVNQAVSNLNQLDPGSNGEAAATTIAEAAKEVKLDSAVSQQVTEQTQQAAQALNQTPSDKQQQAPTRPVSGLGSDANGNRGALRVPGNRTELRLRLQKSRDDARRQRAKFANAPANSTAESLCIDAAKLVFAKCREEKPEDDKSCSEAQTVALDKCRTEFDTKNIKRECRAEGFQAFRACIGEKTNPKKGDQANDSAANDSAASEATRQRCRLIGAQAARNCKATTGGKGPASPKPEETSSKKPKVANGSPFKPNGPPSLESDGTAPQGGKGTASQESSKPTPSQKPKGAATQGKKKPASKTECPARKQKTTAKKQKNAAPEPKPPVPERNLAPPKR